ncbi:lipopolysaccharide biosynthesis protein [Spirosoma sp. BT702]|uniref:Lipopolysaccharide biosynthesis protein n=1 Tax=Spirosoma profusum TaxID=2771354 RepID=A0A927ARE8_9BACT|nr:Wzz/FepE/Etk N-terminal domain-containing protein [Spirosoma profusum]MBD2699630.1 lipopolysaccharide biosynthesis protein [Spirosoma profusum]
MSVTESHQKEKSNGDELEIRLGDILNFLKSNRLKIILWAGIGLVIGIVYAFSKQNVYTSQTTVLPEIQTKAGNLGNLSSLAGLAGIDIGSGASAGTDAIRPDVYPDVLQSVPFALHLLKQPVYSKLFGKETSLEQFINEVNKPSWLGSLFNSEDPGKAEAALPVTKSKPLVITKKQENLVLVVHESVAGTYDKKTGKIQVTTTWTDPIVAATVAKLSLDYLTEYISGYRTEKARSQVLFLESRLSEAKSRYQLAEYALSKFRDQNRSLYLNTAKIEEQRLQADYILAQGVFGDLSKQLEQAKIKVAEDAPVFKLLEPARVPLKKSGPKRSVLILVFGFVGLFLSILYYGGRQVIVYLDK